MGDEAEGEGEEGKGEGENSTSIYLRGEGEWLPVECMGAKIGIVRVLDMESFCELSV